MWKYIFKLIKSGSQDSHSNLTCPITGKTTGFMWIILNWIELSSNIKKDQFHKRKKRWIEIWAKKCGDKFFWIWCPLIKLRLWFHKIRLSAKLRAAELSRLLVTAIKHVTNDRRPPTSFFPCANYYTCAKRVKIHNPWNYIIIMERAVAPFLPILCE